MCLKEFTPNKEPVSGPFIGYKVFSLSKDYAGGDYILSGMPVYVYSIFIDCVYQVGIEYTAKKNIVDMVRGGIYISAFHIFDNLEDAYSYYNYILNTDLVIFEVEYNEVTGSGIDESGIPCVLANKMKLLKKIK